MTPDSFSDGGLYSDVQVTLQRARELVADGADIIDVGGESTRPGAPPVSVAEELERVIPVVEVLARELNVPISVDTSKPTVMREAVQAGACIINDVNALRAEGALACAASLPGVAFVLMHMQGEPRSMQAQPQYTDVLSEVMEFLAERQEVAVRAGIPKSQLVFDPGIGFGKTLAHNLSLLQGIPDLVDAFGRVLIGVSRKSMFAQLLGDRPPLQRVAASVQAGMLAVQAGAAILRVHDVRETAEALHLWQAIRAASRPQENADA